MDFDLILLVRFQDAMSLDKFLVSKETVVRCPWESET